MSRKQTSESGSAREMLPGQGKGIGGIELGLDGKFLVMGVAGVRHSGVERCQRCPRIV